MKLALTILLCLSLCGCATLKDFFSEVGGGVANVPVGFEITHECLFNYPARMVVVGFRIVEKDGPGRCGQVMLPVDKVVDMSRNELAEYVFAQFVAGMFSPCKEELPNVTVQPRSLGSNSVGAGCGCGEGRC